MVFFTESVLVLAMAVAGVTVLVTNLEGPRLPSRLHILFFGSESAQFGVLRAMRQRWFGTVAKQSLVFDDTAQQIAAYSVELFADAQPTVLARGVRCKFCVSFYLALVAAVSYQLAAVSFSWLGLGLALVQALVIWVLNLIILRLMGE